MQTTSTSPKSLSDQPIPKRELLNYRAEVKGELFRQIRRRFTDLRTRFAFTQSHLAKRLNMDEGLLSRRVRGENDMRLETLSDLARGLECRIDVKLTPLEQVAAMNEASSQFLSDVLKSTSYDQMKSEEQGRALLAAGRPIRTQLAEFAPSERVRKQLTEFAPSERATASAPAMAAMGR